MSHGTVCTRVAQVVHGCQALAPHYALLVPLFYRCQWQRPLATRPHRVYRAIAGCPPSCATLMSNMRPSAHDLNVAICRHVDRIRDSRNFVEKCFTRYDEHTFAVSLCSTVAPLTARTHLPCQPAATPAAA